MRSPDIDWVSPVNWQHQLNSGMVGWWLAMPGAVRGGTWPNLVPGRPNGTLTNMDPGSDWISGVRTGGWGALDFDGSNDYVEVPTIPITDITVSVWMYSRANPQTGMLVMKNPVNADWSLFHDSANIRWRGGAAGGSTAFAAPPINEWHHIVGRQKGTVTALYLDGEQQISSTHTALSNGTGLINFGRYSSGFYFNGRLDDIHIWNRALTDAEIQDLYLESKSGYPNLLRRVPTQIYVSFDLAVSQGANTPFYVNRSSSPDIDWVSPVNWQHEMNRNLAAWWLNVPPYNTGRAMRMADLTGGGDLVCSIPGGGDADPVFEPASRPGGWGHLSVDIGMEAIAPVPWGLDADGQWSIAWWGKSAGAVASTYDGIIGITNLLVVYWHATDFEGFRFQFNHSGADTSWQPTSHHISWDATDDLMWDETDFITWEPETGFLDETVWHHYVLVTDNTTEYLWIDGKSIPLTSNTALTNLTAVDGVVLGHAHQSFGSDLHVDDVRIWRDRALRDDEVLSLYLESKMGYPYQLRRTPIGFSAAAAANVRPPFYHHRHHNRAA